MQRQCGQATIQTTLSVLRAHGSFPPFVVVTMRETQAVLRRVQPTRDGVFACDGGLGRRPGLGWLLVWSTTGRQGSVVSIGVAVADAGT